ncbi:MAG TPA: dihydroneopterin aldolase [bacterium]|nr:dihydroneopterin aldolase [bacterium]
MERVNHPDRITIQGINVLGHHGVDEAERKVGQRLAIDVELHLDLRGAAAKDDIRKTVNYEDVANLIEKVAGEEEFLLLESLAEEIARKVLAKFAPSAVVVRVRKMNLPISTRVASVEVEIRRDLVG